MGLGLMTPFGVSPVFALSKVEVLALSSTARSFWKVKKSASSTVCDIISHGGMSSLAANRSFISLFSKLAISSSSGLRQSSLDLFSSWNKFFLIRPESSESSEGGLADFTRFLARSRASFRARMDVCFWTWRFSLSSASCWGLPVGWNCDSVFEFLNFSI